MKMLICKEIKSIIYETVHFRNIINTVEKPSLWDEKHVSFILQNILEKQQCHISRTLEMRGM